jgi:hypothetical protein
MCTEASILAAEMLCKVAKYLSSYRADAISYERFSSHVDH